MNVLKERHKIELCKNFIDNQHCPYGLKCKFAHGFD